MAKPLTINNWTKGTGASSYVGFEEMRCVDILNEPGAILASDSLVKESAAIVDDQIFMTCIDDNGVLYGIAGSDNSVFKRTQTGVWTELDGFAAGGLYGIAFFMGNIILIHSNGSLDASVNDGDDWTNGFATITNNANTTSPNILAQDGLLYICQGNDVDALGVGTTDFDPTGSAVTNWSLSLAVLVLPANYEIRNVVALGNSLLFGTIDNQDDNNATIFPWNRQTQDSNQPIRIKENGITYMIEVENLVYVMAGVKGRWYVTNGSSVNFLAEIPRTMFDLSSLNLDNTFNDAVAYNEGLIYFGVSSILGTAGIGNRYGVYSLNPKTGSINFAHIISTDNIGVTVGLNVASITKALKTISGKAKETIIVTWKNNTATASYGADALGSTKYTSDRAFFVSPFYQVGTATVPASFDRCEIRLARPLASGDSMKIWYRTAQNEVWTTYGDPWITEDTVGFQQEVIQYENIAKQITNVKNIQFKVSLNQDTELLELIIK